MIVTPPARDVTPHAPRSAGTSWWLRPRHGLVWTADRQATGPIWNRGQDKTADGGGGETEQHLVLVPDQRIDTIGQHWKAGEDRHPDRLK